MWRADATCNENIARIQYITVNSRTDAEYIESHLISLYGTDKWYNKSKSGYGVSSFLPKEFKWLDYNDPFRLNIQNEVYRFEYVQQFLREHLNIDYIHSEINKTLTNLNISKEYSKMCYDKAESIFIDYFIKSPVNCTIGEQALTTICNIDKCLYNEKINLYSKYTGANVLYICFSLFKKVIVEQINNSRVNQSTE